MYVMCVKCGMMYDDANGGCPNCGDGAANQSNAQSSENKNSKPSQNRTVVQNTSYIKASASSSSSSSKSSSGSSSTIPKPVIAVMAIGLVGIIVAITAVAVVSIMNKEQPADKNSGYTDAYTDEYADEPGDDYADEIEGDYQAGETPSIPVYFEFNNGDPIQQIVIEPGLIEEPAEPVREGYIFDGWYDAGLENKWDFSNDKTGQPLTLYAKWIEASENEKLVLAVDGLRLRETPELSGKKIGLIPNGTHIIVEDTVDGWSYTTYKGQSGWCSSEFLYNPADYEGEVLFKAYVDNKNGITLYVNEHTESEVINDNISYKSTVYVYEVDDLWSYVRYGDEYGWCLSEDLDDYR